MQEIKQVENHIYQRFLRVPAKIAAALGWVTLLALIEAFGLQWGFWGLAIGVVFSPVLALMSAAFALNAMKKERVFLWLRGKFDSWKEAKEWMDKLTGRQLNDLAGMSDKEWQEYDPSSR